uniref:BACK domain-containing protein n=1 Tax=Rhabditophanes sp. KR3021 TaxID=114890 RepID=A0AC35TUK4_9BILA
MTSNRADLIVFVLEDGCMEVPRASLINSSNVFDELLHRIKNKDELHLKNLAKADLEAFLKYPNSKCVVNKENVIGLIKCQNEFNVPDLEKLIHRWIEGNCEIEFYTTIIEKCLNQNCERLFNCLKQLIRLNFNKLCNINAFNKLSLIVMINLFDVSLTHMLYQEKVYNVFLNWVKADLENRKSKWLELLCLLNFNDISPKFIKNELLNNKSLEVAEDVKNYILKMSENMDLTKVCLNDEKNYIYLIGGSANNSRNLKIYDIKNKQFQNETTLTTYERINHCCELINNKLFILGGENTTKIEVFDIETNTIEQLKIEMYDKIDSFSTVVLDNKIYSFMGRKRNKATNLGRIFDAEKMIWTKIKYIELESYGHQSFLIDNIIYITPGANENQFMHRYDPRENIWTLMAKMPGHRKQFAVSKYENNLLFCGGDSSNNFEDALPTKDCDLYDLKAKSWRKSEALPVPLYGAKSCEIEDNILVFGGQMNKNEYLSYSKLTNEWIIEKIDLDFVEDPQELLSVGREMYKRPTQDKGSLLIPQIILASPEKEFPFTFTRMQFSTLSRVSLDLTKDCFTHGQLYVGLSRVKSSNHLFISTPNDKMIQTNATDNIIFKEVFQ